jgi:hypothetical protein
MQTNRCKLPTPQPFLTNPPCTRPNKAGLASMAEDRALNTWMSGFQDYSLVILYKALQTRVIIGIDRCIELLAAYSGIEGNRLCKSYNGASSKGTT